MIGHHVKRYRFERLREKYENNPKKTESYKNNRYKPWKPKTNGLIYKSYKDIPLEPCEICGQNPLNNITNSAMYDVSVKVYRHHIYPRIQHGDKHDWNTTRDKFCLLCGKCHDKVHAVLTKTKAKTDEAYYEAIKIVKLRWINRKIGAKRW